MHVIDQPYALNLFGRIRYEDIYEFFEKHEQVTYMPEGDAKCSCGYESLDWADHMREEFIGWIKNL